MQISLCIHTVWSGSLQLAVTIYIFKIIPQADSESPDQITRIGSLIRVIAFCIYMKALSLDETELMLINIFMALKGK